MADVKYNWPENHRATLIGKRVDRLDGMEKSDGSAKYTYDVNLPNQLVAIGRKPWRGGIRAAACISSSPS